MSERWLVFSGDVAHLVNEEGTSWAQADKHKALIFMCGEQSNETVVTQPQIAPRCRKCMRAAGLVPEEPADLTVYQLATGGGTRQGLYQSIEGAQAAAQVMVDDWIEMLRQEDPDEYEPITRPVLTWAEERHDPSGPESRPDRLRLKRGPWFTDGPFLTAFYSEGAGGYFVIAPKRVRP